MQVPSSPSLLYQRFLEFYPDRKLLLLHPAVRERGLFMAQLLTTPPCPLFYYGLSIEDTTLPRFIDGFFRQLGHGSVNFELESEDTRELVSYLVQQLAELPHDNYLIVFDEYDRADSIPEIQDFVEYLLEDLPDNIHLLINSRTLPRLPWVVLLAKKEAVILGGDFSPGHVIDPNQDRAHIQVYAFGTGYVFVDHEQIQWEGHLARELFFFMVDRRKATREDIFEAIWPELAPDQASNVFHVTKRRLHRILGYDILEYAHGQVST